MIDFDRIVVKTFKGLEEPLIRELTAIGAEKPSALKRAVECTGDEELLYRILMYSRLALRVLLPVKEADVEDEDQLYEFGRSIDWQEILSMHKTFAVDTVSFHEQLNHQIYLSQRLKDAVVDQFRDKYGMRPNVNPQEPDLLINLHLAPSGRATISLDASGKSLNRRGYRVSGGDAPLNEVLAAGIIDLSGWDPETPFVDPMCGSGTLLIEAALKAKNKAPGFFHKDLGIFHWPYFRNGLWKKIHDEAFHRVRTDVNWIYGNDISRKAVAIASKNIKQARLVRNIKLQLGPMDRFHYPPGPATIVTNPPYGERMSQHKELNELYKQLPGMLKHKAAGYNVALFTADKEMKKRVKLKEEELTQLMNGSIPSELVRYSIRDHRRKEAAHDPE